MTAAEWGWESELHCLAAGNLRRQLQRQHCRDVLDGNRQRGPDRNPVWLRRDRQCGVSLLVVVPTPSASLSMMGTPGPSPSTTIGTSTPSMLGAPTMPSVMGTAGLSTNQTATPCGTIVTGGPAMNC